MDQAAIATIIGLFQDLSEPSVSIPPKWEPAEYTQYFVKEAISRYDAEGLDATLAWYNTEESIDGQWYMFILDQNDIMLAHAANTALIDRPAPQPSALTTIMPERPSFQDCRRGRRMVQLHIPQPGDRRS